MGEERRRGNGAEKWDGVGLRRELWGRGRDGRGFDGKNGKESCG